MLQRSELFLTCRDHLHILWKVYLVDQCQRFDVLEDAGLAFVMIVLKFTVLQAWKREDNYTHGGKYFPQSYIRYSGIHILPEHVAPFILFKTSARVAMHRYVLVPEKPPRMMQEGPWK